MTRNLGNYFFPKNKMNGYLCHILRSSSEKINRSLFAFKIKPWFKKRFRKLAIDQRLDFDQICPVINFYLSFTNKKLTI